MTQLSVGADGTLADVLIKDGKIAEIGDLSSLYDDAGCNIYDMEGMLLLPSLVDVHTHLRDPGFEYKEDIESGSRAAIKGGFSAIACMANTKPVNDSATVTEKIIKAAREVNLCDIYPVGAATKSLCGESLAEIGDMHQAGIVAVSDDGMPIMNGGLSRKVFEYASMFELPVISHCEDHSLSCGGQIHESAVSTFTGLKGIPSASESVMVYRDIELARLTGAHLHLAHLSCKESVRLVEQAKEEGVHVTAEVTPHHLLLSVEDLQGYDANFKVNPPIRSEEDRQALVEGVKSGVIDMIASDHAPHHELEKNVEFDHAPCGINGLETALPSLLALVRKGELSLKDIERCYSEKPSGFLGIPWGGINCGNDANVVVVDPLLEQEITPSFFHSRSFNTPLLGEVMQGFAVMTLRRGKIVYSGKGIRKRRRGSFEKENA